MPQMSVDIATPPEVFEGVQKDVDAHFKANPAEYTGQNVVVANFAGDPMKFMLCVWWEYSHPGRQLPAPALVLGADGWLLADAFCCHRSRSPNTLASGMSWK